MSCHQMICSSQSNCCLLIVNKFVVCSIRPATNSVAMWPLSAKNNHFRMTYQFVQELQHSNEFRELRIYIS